MICEETSQSDDLLRIPFDVRMYIGDHDGDVGKQDPEAGLPIASVSRAQRRSVLILSQKPSENCYSHGNQHNRDCGVEASSVWIIQHRRMN
jgi:hypothetical protein